MTLSMADHAPPSVCNPRPEELQAAREPRTFWISAAETSGDLHGAELIRALKKRCPEATFVGAGGHEMEQAGLEATVHIRELSLIGLTEVVPAIPRILRIFKRVKRALQSHAPTCVILIDAPDFNFRVAKMANKLGIPVFYYISPQVWAWRTSRVDFLRRHVQRVLCILPFEKDFFSQHKVDVDYVGHPLLEQMDLDRLDSIAAEEHVVGLMPGSRQKEISTLMPEFARAARIIHQTFPATDFVLLQAPNIEQSAIKSFWPDDLPCRFIPFDQRYAAMKSCWLILTASGTASLECALLRVPALVAYRLSVVSYLIGKLVIRVPYISLPNLILGEQGLPEFIQSQATGDNLGRTAVEWLSHPEMRARVQGKIMAVRNILGPNKASEKTADLITQALGETGSGEGVSA